MLYFFFPLFYTLFYIITVYSYTRVYSCAPIRIITRFLGPYCGLFCKLLFFVCGLRGWASECVGRVGPVKDSNYRVFRDNFFGSPSLFHPLLTHGIYACGTVRPNHQKFPTQLRGLSFAGGEYQSQQWGQLTTLQCPTVIVTRNKKINTEQNKEKHKKTHMNTKKREQKVKEPHPGRGKGRGLRWIQREALPNQRETEHRWKR